MATQQIELPGIPAPEPKSLAITTMSLMQLALETGKVEQLQILQDMHFKQMARDAEIEFNQALNQIQAEVGRIAPNMTNPQTRSQYATYDKLDSVLRPVYTRHGLSLSFSEEDSPKAEHVRIVCYVSHANGHTRMYRKDMPIVTKGIKGNEMMTPTHAAATAESYAKRYLLKDIFNLAIGEDDTDGNAPQPQGGMLDDISERIEWIKNSSNFQELESIWRDAYAAAKKAKDQKAIEAINFATNARKRELREAGKQ